MGEVIGMVKQAGPQERAKYQAEFLRQLAAEYETDPENAPEVIVVLSAKHGDECPMMDSSDVKGKENIMELRGMLYTALDLTLNTPSVPMEVPPGE